MKVYILLLIGIWAGLVIGLSFVEAPLKFQAPGISTKLGLGIGRLVFGFSNKIQLFLLVLLSIGLVYNISSLAFNAKLFLATLFVIAVVQTLYLLPALDVRAVQVINNQTVPDSPHHIYFVGLELLKVGTLIFLFINLYNRWTI